MKNKGIVIFVLILVATIVLVLTLDYRSGKIDNSRVNPYEYNYDEYKKVDTALIKYTETRQIKLNFAKPTGLSVQGQKIYMVGDSFLQVIDVDGNEYMKIQLTMKPTTIAVKNQIVVIAYANMFEVRSLSGELIIQSDTISKSSVLTSVALSSNEIFLADAGQRKVLVYDLNAQFSRNIEGVSGIESLHGFIVPSASFDLAINEAGELWVTNPGIHSIQHYSMQGDLLNYWANSSLKVEGFCGCCNPANFTFLPNGNVITSEKGLVRIKEYLPTGELLAVVAAPEKFLVEGASPDVATDDQGTVFALDKDKIMLRIFKAKK